MRTTRLAVALFALCGMVQTHSGDLMEGFPTSDDDERQSLSLYSGTCKGPVVQDSGFKVTYRICEDTLLDYSEDHDGVESGANPGPPPEDMRLITGYGGCTSGFTSFYHPRNSQMNPKFTTDDVYKGEDVYQYPKGISEPNFWRETEWPTNGNLYGKHVQTVGFSLELEGYYLAPQTGIYHILITADDGASVQFGEGIRCCEDVRKDDFKDLKVVALTSDNEEPDNLSKITSQRTSTYTVELKKGVYYPMRVVYFNNVRSFILDLKVVLPDHRVESNWSDVKILEVR